MDAQPEFEALRHESSSWWHTARRKLLREAVAQAVHGKRDARVMDLGCAAQLDCPQADSVRVLNAHSSLPALAFRQIEGSQNLICTSSEDLGFVSNSFAFAKRNVGSRSGHSRQSEPRRIRAEAFDDLQRIDNVTLGL